MNVPQEEGQRRRWMDLLILQFSEGGITHSRVRTSCANRTGVPGSRMAVPDGQKPVVDYGPLEARARNGVNLKRIETHWPDQGCERIRTLMTSTG